MEELQCVALHSRFLSPDLQNLQEEPHASQVPLTLVLRATTSGCLETEMMEDEMPMLLIAQEPAKKNTYSFL